jgi:AraC family transcriptional regulator, regulatory protein of adaptative response / methylated-DNA-[protein]-cysteine methyltransferase
MITLPSTQTMYAALLKRDSAFEGVFFAGIKTTGIFCRPTCGARKPRLENVEYFSSTQEALYAGYRPCARCHPMDREKQKSDLVKKLNDLFEKSPTHKITGQELRLMGIEPSTARRQFKRTYGMTFQAFQRARRMGEALHEIRKGEKVITAQLNQGFSSSSGFWEAFKQVFGTPPSQANAIHCLQARWIDTPLGAMVALADQDGLHMLEFVDRRGLENEIAKLRRQTESVIVPGNNLILEKINEEMKNYFEGSSVNFTVPLVVKGSEFEHAVWKLLQQIPPGETWSYRQLAEKLGKPTATRAVGNANGRNILAIVIPCHRVIRSDGSLCGYGGGVWRKKWLLDHERNRTTLNTGK